MNVKVKREWTVCVCRWKIID